MTLACPGGDPARAAGTCCRSGGRRRLGHPAVDQRDPEEVPEHLQCEPRPCAHPRTAPVAPLDRDDGDPVVATTREVDELHVKNNARDLLLGKEIVRGRASECLEATLGVLDR